MTTPPKDTPAWYEWLRTYCKNCRQYGVVSHETEQGEWCPNMSANHTFFIKRCAACGRLDRHLAPTAIFEYGTLILCDDPTESHKKNLRHLKQPFSVRPHLAPTTAHLKQTRLVFVG